MTTLLGILLLMTISMYSLLYVGIHIVKSVWLSWYDQIIWQGFNLLSNWVPLSVAMNINVWSSRWYWFSFGYMMCFKSLNAFQANFSIWKTSKLA